MDPSQVNDPKYSYDDPEVNYGPAPPAYGGAQQMTPIPSQPQHSVSASNVTVVVNQPTTQQQNPLMATTLDGHRTWTTGLFDCFADMGSCKCFDYHNNKYTHASISHHALQFREVKYLLVPSLTKSHLTN